MQIAIGSRLRVLILVLFVASLPARSMADDTVFFVVRHAEKAAPSGDPPLSPAGAKRAQQLMHTLEYLRINAIYHTDFVRTRETALPLAMKLNVTTTTYSDPSQAWIDSVVAARKGQRTLIVGHSDTVNLIVGRLAGKSIPAIGEHYDNLFVVVLSDSGAAVAQLEYGEAN